MCHKLVVLAPLLLKKLTLSKQDEKMIYEGKMLRVEKVNGHLT